MNPYRPSSSRPWQSVNTARVRLKAHAAYWGFGIGAGIPAVLGLLGLFRHAFPEPINVALEPLDGHAGLGPLIQIFFGIPIGGAVGILIGTFVAFIAEAWSRD